jgi:hypothetical protein
LAKSRAFVVFGASMVASMVYGNRKNGRVEFDPGIPAWIMADDGRWRRDCVMADVSQYGARLIVKNGTAGLDLYDFLLMLTENGRVSRRCRMVRNNGTEIGVRFVGVQADPNDPVTAGLVRRLAPAEPSPP